MNELEMPLQAADEQVEQPLADDVDQVMKDE